jgi:hypothetical protein
VSLLFPEKIRIGLGASYAVLAQIKGGMVSSWRMQTWQPTSATAWQQPLAAVTSWLAELSPKSAHVGVVLSAELAPLQLLPWRDDVTGAEQQSLLASAHFRQIHGGMAEHWKILAQPSGYGKPWLASATDEHLLQALAEQVHATGARLASVTPLTMSLFNVMHTRLSAPACWLLVPEPQRLTALHFREGLWSLLQTLPMTALQHEPLADLLLRETRLAGLPDMAAKIYLATGGLPATPFNSTCTALDPGWRFAPGVPPESPLHLLGGGS